METVKDNNCCMHACIEIMNTSMCAFGDPRCMSPIVRKGNLNWDAVYKNITRGGGCGLHSSDNVWNE